MAPRQMCREEAARRSAEIARQERAAQGLPPQVDDPAVYARIGRLLAGRRQRTATRGAA